MYWIKIGEKKGWLYVAVGQCLSYPNKHWNDINLPKPAVPRNECTDGTHLCSDTAYCSNAQEPYSCACRPGYSGNGYICTNIDECIAGSHICDQNANCIDTVGHYNCKCNTGYSGDGFNCANIDECELLTCPSYSSCVDSPGSYNCACNPGLTTYNRQTYTRPHGYSCNYDINECNDGSHNCSQNATCQNTHGSYHCTCKNGFSGDGDTCVNFDECSNDSHRCDLNANCTDTIGS